MVVDHGNGEFDREYERVQRQLRTIAATWPGQPENTIFFRMKGVVERSQLPHGTVDEYDLRKWAQEISRQLPPVLGRGLFGHRK